MSLLPPIPHSIIIRLVAEQLSVAHLHLMLISYVKMPQPYGPMQYLPILQIVQSMDTLYMTTIDYVSI